MKKLIIILLLYIPVSLFATTYYIRVGGSDAAAGTSTGTAFASLHHACSVAVSGDLIDVSGSITDNTQCVLAAGVNITGTDSSATHITTSYVGGSDAAAFLLLSSGSLTSGNQTISNISFNGNNLTSDRFCYVKYRSNVTFDHVTVEHFSQFGIDFVGTSGNYLDNDIIANCRINDCAPTHSSEGGCISIAYTSAMLIHDCMLVDTSRSAGNNGNIIHGAGGSASFAYNKGMKYYNNVSWKPLNDVGNAYNAHLEFWYSEGMEFYNNTFNGGGYDIDDGGTGFTLTGNYSYKFNIHDNIFQQSIQVPSTTNYFNLPYNCESGQGKSYFKNNTLINCTSGIQILIGYANNTRCDSVTITNNTFKNNGFSDNLGGAHGFISIAVYQNGFHAHDDTISNVLIWNNTAKNFGGTGRPKSFLVIQCDSIVNLVKNIKLQNNIIDSAAVSYGYIAFWDYTAMGIIDSVSSTNNIVVNNVNSNNPYYRGLRDGTNVTHFTETSIQKTDPLINTDFSLTAVSPAIDAGIDVGLPFSGSAPDEGYLEYTPPATSSGTIKLKGNRKVR